MSELLEKLKECYRLSEGSMQWHDYYPNNNPRCGKEGIYTFFWLPNRKEWDFIKYTIKYQHPIDNDGRIHTEEPVKYYVLFEHRSKHGMKKTIPAPDSEHNPMAKETDTELSPYIVNDFGSFCFVFSDEETAKEIVKAKLKNMIYPYLSILSDEEGVQWNQFMEKYENT